MSVSITRVLVPSVLLALSAISFACGEDAEGDTGSTETGAQPSTGGSGKPAAAGETYQYNGTLVSILATDESMRIGIPHLIELRNNDTGAPLVPPISTMSAAGTGAISFKTPKGVLNQFWVRGTGEGSDGTYDTVLVNATSERPDKLIRISTGGLIGLAEGSAGYVGKPDRASLGGSVYWSPDKLRKGTVGCAKVYLDDATGPDLAQDQRYNGASGLPAPISCTEPAGTCVAQTETLSSGRFYFGNITKGTHTLKVSLDDGKTFIGEPTKFFVPYTRAEASSPTKNLIVQIALDMDYPANPTLPTCKS